jgi:hypothetical protein
MFQWEKGGVKKKPISISEYNMFMKGVDKANQYLAYYSPLRKRVKWPKKVVLCSFQFIGHI